MNLKNLTFILNWSFPILTLNKRDFYDFLSGTVSNKTGSIG